LYHESVPIAGISEESALGRGVCAGVIIGDPDELRPKVLLRDKLIISSNLFVAYR
jgi:hypothetical protein